MITSVDGLLCDAFKVCYATFEYGHTSIPIFELDLIKSVNAALGEPVGERLLTGAQYVDREASRGL